MPFKPDLDKLTSYYAKSMMTKPMKWFCRRSGKRKFSEKTMNSLREAEKQRAGDKNPYSWNMELLEYSDQSGYEACLTKCGICALMKEYGLFELTPALCHLDYTLNDAGHASAFFREHTIASGHAYCDCGYRKKEKR